MGDEQAEIDAIILCARAVARVHAGQVRSSDHEDSCRCYIGYPADECRCQPLDLAIRTLRGGIKFHDHMRDQRAQLAAGRIPK